MEPPIGRREPVGPEDGRKAVPVHDQIRTVWGPTHTFEKRYEGRRRALASAKAIAGHRENLDSREPPDRCRISFGQETDCGAVEDRASSYG